MGFSVCVQKIMRPKPAGPSQFQMTNLTYRQATQHNLTWCKLTYTHTFSSNNILKIPSTNVEAGYWKESLPASSWSDTTTPRWMKNSINVILMNDDSRILSATETFWQHGMAFNLQIAEKSFWHWFTYDEDRQLTRTVERNGYHDDSIILLLSTVF